MYCQVWCDMENSKLRRNNLIKEKYRLKTLLYYYKKEEITDSIIESMIKNIDNELYLLDEQRDRKKRGLP